MMSLIQLESKITIDELQKTVLKNGSRWEINKYVVNIIKIRLDISNRLLTVNRIYKDKIRLLYLR